MQGVRRARWRASVIAGSVAALLVAGTAVAVGAQAATGCRVAYTVPAQWPGGFTADVAVTNLGEPLDGWSLEWSFTAGQEVTQAWNATVSSSEGIVTAENMSYNAELGTDETVSFGFNGSWSGTNPEPTSFTLNGVSCTGDIATPSPSVSPSVSPSPSPTSSPRPSDPMAMVAAMEPGWNLGNTLDAIPDETAWGNPLTSEALLQQVRSQGYNSIRLPITWSNRHGPAPDYTIDPDWLDRVREIVDWSLAEDFYVMINLHHDSWQWINAYPNDPTTVMDRYTALWTQLADAFRDYPKELVFESINEPQFADTSDAEGDQLVHEFNVEFHRIVRESGGNNTDRLLVLPTLHTSTDQARLDALLTTFDQLDDANLVATVHFYGWWPFSVNIAGGTHYDATVEQDLIDTFDRVHDTFVANDIPVIIGEWALLNWDHTRPGVIQRGEFLKFLEAVGYHARTRELTTMVWDAGQFLHREELQWRDQGVYEMFKASWTSRSGTASADHVYVPQSGSITSRDLTLNQNGLSFQGLWQDDEQLAEGSDYTVAGDTLTLTGPAMTRLVDDRAYGVNSTIEARFSQGTPWQINIITYDTPTQTTATGTTSSFAIPTEFHGDQLATMAARYADGSNAGPAEWTPFKEFWQHFQPDYDAGAIILKPEFFDEVDDGQVTLTFHFWSGTQITYEIVKSGSTVTGSTG
ncbi:cellulase family glycosylhydrolase [Natronosporangium hydrolyticum]|uniref:cellulase n=1 Tax=Natronosporangium hydrolyticum TaxID=2811111 RepID=A0A895YRI6_9ACTN|nr:cellulase family glycosylhydrolase [Natronosporangium hydrolyticum]QSB16730.1 cellulase family glycosylhydrolase [Natronosporangium hydrolyticum]